MSTHTLSRRSIVAGAAALPVAAVPAIASVIEPDPIFAAIEAHEVTFTHYVRMSEIVSSMLLDTPGYEQAEQADEEAAADDLDAAMELAAVVPTTTTGVLALMDYVCDFNEGKFVHNDQWMSGPLQWPGGSSFEFEVLMTRTANAV
jgi:hypothetical protein